MVSLQPTLVPERAPPPPGTPTRDARGLAPHLVIQMGGTDAVRYSKTRDETVVFGADPGSYRLRVGWAVAPNAGGANEVRVVHRALIQEPLPFTERFELTVLAPDDGTIIAPIFPPKDFPAPYTHLRVLRGGVLDERGLVVPLNVDLTFSAYYWAPQNALYKLVLAL